MPSSTLCVAVQLYRRSLTGPESARDAGASKLHSHAKREGISQLSWPSCRKIGDLGCGRRERQTSVPNSPDKMGKLIVRRPHAERGNESIRFSLSATFQVFPHGDPAL